MIFETRKLHITVPLELYNFIKEKKLFTEIDGIIIELLLIKYNITLK